MIIPFVRSEMKDLSFHDRLCSLLREQRIEAGKSLAEIAADLSVTAVDVQAWETATISPPANKYYAAVSGLGQKAFEKAATLWTDFQITKYLAYLSRREADQRLGQGDSLGYVNRTAA